VTFRVEFTESAAKAIRSFPKRDQIFHHVNIGPGSSSQCPYLTDAFITQAAFNKLGVIPKEVFSKLMC
jgi:hypothetical protein